MLRLVHASPESMPVFTEDGHWIFGGCTFFVETDSVGDDQDALDAAYSLVAQPVYVHLAELQLGDVCESVDLDDSVARQEIRALWSVSDDVAWDYLRRDVDLDEAVEDGGWHIQRIRGKAAARQGFVAVRDRDEQGEVCIVDMTGPRAPTLRCLGMATWHGDYDEVAAARRGGLGKRHYALVNRTRGYLCGTAMATMPEAAALAVLKEVGGERDCVVEMLDLDTTDKRGVDVHIVRADFTCSVPAKAWELAEAISGPRVAVVESRMDGGRGQGR